MAKGFYNPVDLMAELSKYSAYNMQPGRGVDLAVNRAQGHNATSADLATSQAGDINSEIAKGIRQLLESLNADVSQFATDQTQKLNQQASEFATSQADRLNRDAVSTAIDQSLTANRQASETSATDAVDSADSINRFAAQLAAELNRKYAVPGAGEAATAFNQRATDDVQSSMSQMFGGDLEGIQGQLNQNIQDLLSGDVSQSTRRQLARRALASGNTELGGGAVGDSYAGYLGLTSEGLKAQGQQQFQSLYSMYRQSVPLVSGSQLMPYFGSSASQIGGQTAQMAGQLTGLRGISAQSLFGSGAVTAQQLLGMGGTSARDIYGSNALSAGAMYNSNALASSSLFGANAVRSESLLPLTTLTPRDAIAFEIEQAKAAAQSEARRNQLDLGWFSETKDLMTQPQVGQKMGGPGVGVVGASGLGSSNPWDSGFFKPTGRTGSFTFGNYANNPRSLF
jgi:hypothetical protein